VLSAELVDALRPRLDGALVALDFDGTLAPIVADPMSSRPVGGALDALHALAGRGARIAVITGRDARTVLRLGGLDSVPGLTVAGVYGAETWSSGELESLPTPESIEKLRERLPAVVAPVTADGVWIEDKRLSLVVHARKAADPAAALASVREPVAALAADLDLEIHDGRGVLEIRLPGFDKGAVLRRLAGEPYAPAILFAGDDVGDLPALAVTRELRDEGRHAWSVAVASTEAGEVAGAADVTVESPNQLVALLSALTET
jgi:trehalose 6-phosphate phosphatase